MQLIFFGSGENHWRGAAATRFMTHVAMHQADDDGAVVTWGRQVNDDEYGQGPSIEEDA